MSYLPHLDPGYAVTRVILGALVQSSVVILLGAPAGPRRVSPAPQSAALTLAVDPGLGHLQSTRGCNCRPFGTCFVACAGATSSPERDSGH